MHAFNVHLDGKLIDTVFYSITNTNTLQEQLESVKSSLVNHDGYAPAIVVTWPRGQRLTSDYWELQGDYGHGWECLCAGVTLKEVKANREDYRKNAPCPMRIRAKRERLFAR
jgi:hypothetical protein